MIYKGVCAFFNGAPDSTGDVLSENVTIPHNPVKVTHEFYANTHIGNAHLVVESDRIVAYIDLFDQEIFQPEVATQLTAVIGGSCVKCEGPVIKEWILKEIALTAAPADKSLPTLRQSMRDKCCTYTGVPFKKCFKCGSREST